MAKRASPRGFSIAVAKPTIRFSMIPFLKGLEFVKSRTKRYALGFLGLKATFLFGFYISTAKNIDS